MFNILCYSYFMLLVLVSRKHFCDKNMFHVTYFQKLTIIHHMHTCSVLIFYSIFFFVRFLRCYVYLSTDKGKTKIKKLSILRMCSGEYKNEDDAKLFISLQDVSESYTFQLN